MSGSDSCRRRLIWLRVRKNGQTSSRGSSKFYAEAEDNLQKQTKEGKAENADLDHLRYERLGVEIDLEVLRRGMAE
jgi:hypothetical protein